MWKDVAYYSELVQREVADKTLILTYIFLLTDAIYRENMYGQKNKRVNLYCLV